MDDYPDYLRLALSHVEVNDEICAHLAAVLVRGGSVISIGKNRPKMNSYVLYYGDHDGTASVHAEIDAIFRARRKIDLSGCKLYVARKTKRGETALAAPCQMCMRAIQRYGIKRVYYTIDDQTWGELKIRRDDDIKRRRR